MKHTSIVLSVSLVALAGLALYMYSATSEESDGLLTRLDSVVKNKMASMLPDPESLLLVQDFSNSKYGPYNDPYVRSVPSNWQEYYSLYGLSIYDLYREYLKHGGYIGSPLFRSRRELYRTCLQYARYTYECQNGAQ